VSGHAEPVLRHEPRGIPFLVAESDRHLVHR
jgi:hypothetical protein